MYQGETMIVVTVILAVGVEEVGPVRQESDQRGRR